MIWNGLLDLLFPSPCVACGARPTTGPFCRECSGSIEPIGKNRCLTCSVRLPIAPRGKLPSPRCRDCEDEPPAFARVHSPFVHGGPIAQAIHRLKYKGRREVARSLAPLLASSCAATLSSVDAIVPIPLHKERRRERGYDQALLLARSLASLSGRPLAPSLLVRSRHTEQQVGLDRVARERNLKGAFQAAPASLGQSLALVDDVVTTGATSRAAAEALSRAGARHVVVVALARAGG